MKNVEVSEALVRKAQQGDKEAIEQLCRGSMQSVYFIALKVLKNEADAEDIMADTMVTIIEKLKDLKEPKAYVSWVNRIAVNKCKNYLAKNKPVYLGEDESAVMDSAELENYKEEFLPEDFALSKEKREVLMEIIKEKTTQAEMMSVLMFYYNGDSIKTIAENMDCAEITVKTRLASARKKIKEGIEEKFGKGVTLLGAAGFLVLGKAMSAEAAALPVPESAANTVVAAVTKAASSTGQTGTVARQTSGNSADGSDGTTAQTGNTQTTTTHSNTGISQTNSTATGTGTAASQAANTAAKAMSTAAQTVAKTGLSMKIAVGIGVLAVVGIVGLTAIMDKADSSNSSNSSLAVQGTEQSQGTNNNSSGNGSSDTGNPDAGSTESSSSENTTDNSSVESSTEDSGLDPSWVAQDIVLTSGTLDYKAPDIYADVTDQCNFIWGHTEDEAVAWFREQYAGYTESYIYSKNMESLNEEDGYDATRTYTIGLEGDNAFAQLEVTSLSSSESQIAHSQLKVECHEFDDLMEQMTNYITYMGLGDYADEIIHGQNLTIETENGKGSYTTAVYFSINENAQKYSMYLWINGHTGSDYQGEYTPYKLEHWDDHYSLSEYFPNSSFDTSSLEAFAMDDFNFSNDNYGRELTLASYSTSYNYRQDTSDAERKDIEFNYTIRKGFGEYDNSFDFTIELEDDKITLDTEGRPDYGKKKSGLSLGAKDITEAQIAELCQVRLEHLKKFDNTIDISKEDLIASYKKEELNEGEAEYYFAGNHQYYISNDFDWIYMTFEIDE